MGDYKILNPPVLKLKCSRNIDHIYFGSLRLMNFFFFFQFFIKIEINYQVLIFKYFSLFEIFLCVLAFGYVKYL